MVRELWALGLALGAGLGLAHGGIARTAKGTNDVTAAAGRTRLNARVAKDGHVCGQAGVLEAVSERRRHHDVQTEGPAVGGVGEEGFKTSNSKNS